MKVTGNLLSLGFIVLFSMGCKKTKPRSSEKAITSFQLSISNNPQLPYSLQGTITGDSILFAASQSVTLTNLTPTINYTGASISPAAGEPQDFSRPVTYTVTAEDGTTITYVVAPSVLSSSKDITSFVFRAVDNPGLSGDLSGTIVNDTIYFSADSPGSVDNLLATVKYTGISISPDSTGRENFNSPVRYVVTAQDNSRKAYVVMVTFDQFVFVGNDNGSLYALDASNGQQVWLFKAGGSIRSSPTVDNGVVYFYCGDGYFYAVNAADGSLKWKYLPNPEDASFGYGSSPTVHSGMVYFVASTNVVALDASSGSLVWSAYNDNFVKNTSPTIVNGVVLAEAIDGAGTIHSFDALTGAAGSSFPGGTGRGNPAVYNGMVYGPDEESLVAAWDLNTHALLFSYPPTNAVGSSPTIFDGIAYVGGTIGLVAVDAGTGALVWQDASVATSDPAAGAGLVFVCKNDSTLNGYDPKIGAKKWTLFASVTTIQNITVSTNRVYVGTADGRVIAVDAQSGNIFWTFHSDAPVYSGPCVMDRSGTVYHTTESGDQQ